MSDKIYYAIAGEGYRDDGTPRMTSDEIGGSDGEISSVSAAGEWAITAMTAVYLLDTTTGLVRKHPLSINTEGSEGFDMKINGVERGAKVKLARFKSVREGRGFEWLDCDHQHIDTDWTFACTASYLYTFLTPFDEYWDLCFRAEVLNTSTLVYRYHLVKKGLYNIHLLDTDMELCEFLRCYFTVLSKMQRRAQLMNVSANSEDFVAVTTKILYREFENLSDDTLRKLPCDLAIQNRQISTYSQLGTSCSSYAVCCELSVRGIAKAAKQKMPFLYYVIHKQGKEAKELQWLLSAIKRYTPTAVVRIV